MYIELVCFIVLFTCHECREFQQEITYNVLITCRECRELINLKWLFVKYTIPVVVMLKKHAGYSSFYFIVGGEEDEYFLLKFSLYTHPDISFKINEWSTEINESEEFLVIFDEPYYICFGPFSNTVPSRSVHTKYTIIVSSILIYTLLALFGMECKSIRPQRSVDSMKQINSLVIELSPRIVVCIYLQEVFT